jgi:hypothetical protein
MADHWVAGQTPIGFNSQKGNANRATLAVARKLVAYLMAVDRETCAA